MTTKNPDLDSHRKTQRNLAILRDDSLCAICFFRDRNKRKAVDVHHVYGRGGSAKSWRESFRYLLCVCRQHHPLPIFLPGSNPNLVWVEEVLKRANDTPINETFDYRC